MKKTALGLLMTCVSSVALAQDGAMSEGIIRMVERNIMSSDVAYMAKPVVKTVENGFDVTVSAGKVKNEAGTPVEAFSFLMKEDGTYAGNKRYSVQLNQLKQIFPSLERLINERNVTYKDINYSGLFVPAISFVEKQDLTVSGLNVPFKDFATDIVVGLVSFEDKSELLAEDKVKQENRLALNNIKLIHPFVTMTVGAFDFNVTVPEAVKASTPIEQLMKTSVLKQKMVLTDAQISSSLMGENMASFDLMQSIEVKQDTVTYNADVDFILNLSDAQVSNQPDAPSSVVADINVTGFNLAQVLAYSATQSKLEETKMLPDSPRKDMFLKSIQTEVDNAYATMTEKMVVTIDEIVVRSEKYASVLQGKIGVKDKSFKGTLQVTNFDYLAPVPKKIDEAACKAVMDKMLTGEIPSEDFQAQYTATCEDGAGVLEVLRPFAATAKKVKDADGKDALLFDIQVVNETLFVNNQKVEEDAYVNPMDMLD